MGDNLQIKIYNLHMYKKGPKCNCKGCGERNVRDTFERDQVDYNNADFSEKLRFTSKCQL